MVANIYIKQGVQYWCPHCARVFNKIDEKGVAICDQCGRKRNDGLNQLPNNYFQCVECKCEFWGGVFQSGPVCPNKGNLKTHKMKQKE